jgi:hypothetical protein
VLCKALVTDPDEAKYLGVTFEELQYEAHLDQVTKKRTKFALVIASLRATGDPISNISNH